MKTWIRNILMVTFVMMMALSLCACGTKTIDLNKYVKIETGGYDGGGTATATFDQEKFAKDHDRDIKLSKEMSTLALYANVSPAVGMMKDCVSGQLSQTAGLSNGDKITFSWNCNDAMAKQLYGVSLKYSDISYKVKDLEKVDTFDPFALITVEFTGTEPAGEMIYNADLSHPEVQYLHFDADKSSGLSNGEEVTIAVSVNGDPETFLAKFGKLPKESEKVYTVSGLSKLVSSSAEIDEACLGAMKQQAEDVFRAYAAERWSDIAILTSCEYAGNYFLMVKDWNASNLKWGSSINRCGIVLKATCHIALDRNPIIKSPVPYDDEFYYVVYFENITKDSQGVCNVNLSNYRTIYHSIYDDHSYGFDSSFWTIADLEKDCINSNLANYYTENNLIA